MHELGLAQSIVDIAQEQIERHRARRVHAIKVLIGDAVAVDPEALSFGFEMTAQSIPALRHAVLAIEHVPHRGRCRDCGEEFAIVDFSAQCPRCGALAVDVVSGTEFQVLEMDIDQD